MPQPLTIDPRVQRAPGSLRFAEVPVHRYRTPLATERKRLGDAALVRILRAMIIIREFETMLGDLKAQGRHGEVQYTHQGPAHLSIGQEAAAVGAAHLLGPDDHVFGSHRSHGEVIAKGLSAIAGADDEWLEQMMRDHDGGELLAVLATHLPAAGVSERAEQFLLAGLMAEIFARRLGFNRGMGGSMHAFFPPLGIYPNNAIVGGSAGIATGAALYKRIRRQWGITVANVGDGATGCGPVWEAMNFAAMEQIRTLWDNSVRGGLPVIFLFNNNFYAMGGQTIGETSGYERLSRIGAAFNRESLHAETVDGNDPLAVIDAIRRKREVLDRGEGPVLLDVESYRISGHSTSDGNAYRTREEIAAWREIDPINELARRLVAEGVLDDAGVTAIRSEVTTLTERLAKLTSDETVFGYADLRVDPLFVGRLMFSDEQRDLPDAPVGELSAPPEQSNRVRRLARRARSGIDEHGEQLSPSQAITMRDALFETVLHHFIHDDELIAYGEENREWGGAFAVYRGLSDVVDYHRLFNAPISEAAIVATAVGYAMEGGRALVELMYTDFIGRAGDELFNQLAKWQAMSGGLLRMPVVVRASVGSKYGAQHSQDWTALIAHISGLQVVYPATPYDAKGLLASALSGSDPVVFFESQRLYSKVELFHDGGVPEGYYRVPLGQPAVRLAGSDLTILTVGPSLYPALEAAAALERDHGVSAEIIDARTIVPFDYGLLLDSVRRTGRALLVSEASERGSVLASIATVINSEAADALAAPVQILGAPNWIVPAAQFERDYFPQPVDIVDRVHTRMLPLDGYRPQGLRTFTESELARRGL